MGKPKKESCKNKDVLSGGLGENMFFSFSMFIAVHNLYF